MSDGSVRVMLCLKEGRLEIEGDSSFVERQLDRFDGLLKTMASAKTVTAPEAKIDSEAAVDQPGDDTSPSKSERATTLGKFVNLYAVANDKVQILKDIPGSNASEKMVNVGLLLAYASFLQSADSTTVKAISEACRSHGCLDATNLSKRLKEQKDAFIFSGARKSQTVTLTVPGRKRAETLAQTLNVE